MSHLHTDVMHNTSAALPKVHLLLFRANRFFPLGFPGLHAKILCSSSIRAASRGSVKYFKYTTLSGITIKRYYTSSYNVL